LKIIVCLLASDSDFIVVVAVGRPDTSRSYYRVKEFNPMPYFQVRLHGEGIDVPSMDGSETMVGFFTTRVVKSHSATEAEAKARQLVTADWVSGSYSTANRSSKIELTVESIAKTTFIRALLFRNSGHVFYTSDEETNE
jgi:hypothetical protein